MIDLNPNGGAIRRWSPRFMTAAGLGMLLLDASPEHDFGFVFGPREDWPSAARARAFAAMLLMPVDGVRQSLDAFGRKSMNALMDGVRAIMSRFGTSALATTYHLKNLGFISDEERVWTSSLPSPLADARYAHPHPSHPGGEAQQAGEREGGGEQAPGGGPGAVEGGADEAQREFGVEGGEAVEVGADRVGGGEEGEVAHDEGDGQGEHPEVGVDLEHRCSSAGGRG
ncbi:MAG: hypothetical protein R3F65_04655 [bacterium]